MKQLLNLSAEIRCGKYAIPLIPLLLFVVTTIAAIVKVSLGTSHINNYLIFEGVFNHMRSETNLYLHYPLEYEDKNHYGPLFSIIIAPFALMPTQLGCLFWCIANTALFYYAITKLHISNTHKNLILLICLFELVGAIQNVQSNPMLAASVILALVFTQNRNVFLATLFIAIGFMVKLYGIVGLSFFFFSKDKLKFALYFIFWLVVLFCLPMIIASPEFVIQSYKDWFAALQYKNQANAVSGMQNMSAMRIGDLIAGKNLPYAMYLIVAGLMALLPLAKIRNWYSEKFQYLYLSLLLICVVIFSSSAEGATFIIAISGVAIWYVMQTPRRKFGWEFWVLIATILLGSLSTTDLFSYSVKNDFIRPYGIKPLPYLIVSIIIFTQLMLSSFTITKAGYEQKNSNSNSGL